MTHSNRKPTDKGRQQERKPVWQWIALVAGALLLAAAVWLVLDNRDSSGDGNLPPKVTGAPVIAITPSQIDFGDVKLGEVVTAEFTVSNQGDQPLRFTEAPYVELVEGC